MVLLVRHAKAAARDAGGDHARPLTARGRADAAALGRWLGRHHLVPDLVVCSDAVRARQTWTAAAAELDDPPPVRSEPLLYEASAQRVLELVAATAEAVRVLAVVGHQPTMSATAVALAGPGSDPATLASVRAGLATSGVAVVRLDVPWSDVAGGTGALERSTTPRG